MLTILLTSLTPFLESPRAPLMAPDPAAALHASIQDSGDPDFDQKLTAAGKDVAKLWALHEECLAADKKDLSKLALKKLIEVEPTHEEAHKALGHRFYDGKWFESYSALSKYKREEEKRMKDELGMERFGDGWAKPEDVPFLKMGWVKDEKLGRWVHPLEIEQDKQVEELRGKGWVQRDDLTWYSPEEKSKVDAGLWKCGEEWLDLAKANEWHSKIGQFWQFSGEHFDVIGTIGRAADNTGDLNWAAWWADRIYPDLVRALGVEPKGKPSFVVLSSMQQYNSFGGGDPNNNIPPTEVSGLSSVHYAYYAETWFLPTQPATYNGVGVCYWDKADEKLKFFGAFAVRHAAAQSYVEAIDPSWRAVGDAIAGQGAQGFQLPAFWAEKKVPRWLRYGVASYVERFGPDRTVGDGQDPWAVRAWAIQNLRAGGDLEPLDTIFTFELDPAAAEASVRRIHESGLLTAFILDGQCAPVTAAHEAFKKALAAGGDTAESVAALQKAISDNAAKLREFAKF